jgi:hypothetical protein
MKYRIDYNIGTVKYLVSFLRGQKKNKDGSEHWDVVCFKAKKRMNEFLKELNNKRS